MLLKEVLNSTHYCHCFVEGKFFPIPYLVYEKLFDLTESIILACIFKTRYYMTLTEVGARNAGKQRMRSPGYRTDGGY